MSDVSVSLRLRPVRFAFLVRLSDKRSTLDIFRINTCLWGGQFNPIIPFFRRLPSWWERQDIRFENAKQVINGYLDFFEPDFLVEAEKGLANELEFDPRRVIRLSDLLVREGERDVKTYGMDVYDLYSELYKKVFQYELRGGNNINIVHVKARLPAFRAFAACVFGDFPAQQPVNYFEKNFKAIFSPKEVSLDAEALSTLYKSAFYSALHIGSERLNVDYHEYRDPTLFILDANEVKDLIDFWNLRAVHRNVVAVPLQWLEELSPFCKHFILDNYRPLPGNRNGVMIRPCSMFSRSIPGEDIKGLYERYLRVEQDGANVLQTWYPPIWRQAPDYSVRTVRPTLEAARKSVDGRLDDEEPEIRFEPLHPEFASDYGDGAEFRWANVVRIQSWSTRDLIATVFPCNYKNPSFPQFGLGDAQLIPTTEGLVIFPRFKNLYERWQLTDGTTALNSWFKRNKIEAMPSDAGRTTQQIIQTLSGFWAVSALANKGIIELLDEMSRKPVTKSMHFREFKNKVHDAVSGDIWRERTFETLVDRKVVQLGLELKCPKCGSWSWHSITGLDYSVTCDLCLRDFDFPLANPTKSTVSRWAYRLIGPFALPNYAGGGYAAALSIRFFAQVLGHMDNSVTWSSGQNLVLRDNHESEADFILWHQRKEIFGLDHPTEVVFGEAKSFGEDAFKTKDVSRLKILAEAFPGSILVFSTLKEAEELSPKEVERIRKLALWGREYDKQRKQSRAPVIMLTGTELFAASHLSIAWKNKGGKHGELIKPGWIRPNNLRVLADLTQQLYLGLPSYSEWRQEKWKRRDNRRMQKSG